jgi:hypothetical protein
MKTLIASAALALAFTAPAFANSQLAASLGVDAGQYTLSELAQIKANKASDDGIAFGVKGNGDTVFSTRGVNGYTAFELAQITANNASDDDIDAPVKSATDVSASSRGVTGGHTQLAASLGVSADTPLSVLAGIIADRASDD